MSMSIRFNSGPFSLEGRLNHQSQTRAAIITHPHPLYGGDMDNAVVAVLAEAYAQAEWATLRFNFRGTGGSSGQFEDGIGEQSDVQAAIDYLSSRSVQRIDLAGYSFGAWVLTGWARRHKHHPHRLILVAPPVAFLDFDTQAPIPGLACVLAGSLDDLAPPPSIDRALPRWAPRARLAVIQGADHSFWGHFQALKGNISEAIQ